MRAYRLHLGEEALVYRPALDVSTRLLRFLPCALPSADGIRPFPLLRLL